MTDINDPYETKNDLLLPQFYLDEICASIESYKTDFSQKRFSSEFLPKIMASEDSVDMKSYNPTLYNRIVENAKYKQIFTTQKTFEEIIDEFSKLVVHNSGESALEVNNLELDGTYRKGIYEYGLDPKFLYILMVENVVDKLGQGETAYHIDDLGTKFSISRNLKKNEYGIEGILQVSINGNAQEVEKDGFNLELSVYSENNEQKIPTLTYCIPLHSNTASYKPTKLNGKEHDIEYHTYLRGALESALETSGVYIDNEYEFDVKEKSGWDDFLDQCLKEFK